MVSLGFFFAALYTASSAVETIFTRYALVEWNVSPVILVLESLLLGAYVQLAIAGYSHGNWFTRSVRQPYTWFYILIQTGIYLITAFLLVLITATEASLLSRAAVIAAVIMAWVFQKRPPRKKDAPWLLLFILAIGSVLFSTRPDALALVALLTLLQAIFTAGKNIITENHPTYLAADNMWNRLRVTGTILFATTSTLLLLLLAIAFAKPHFPTIEILNYFPSLADFRDRNTFIAAIVLGFVITPIDVYANFRSTSLLNAERSLMFRAFLPLAIIAIETPIAMMVDSMNLAAITWRDALAGGLIVIASLGLLAGRKHTSKVVAISIDPENPDDSIFDPQQAQNDLYILQHTLEYFKGDLAKTARALKVPADVLEKIMVDKTYVLSPEFSRKMHNNFSKNIAYLDSLTGLTNKTHFMSLFRNALKAGKTGTVLFIDLNKFKPINDTYGHDAGDTALKTIATRLNTLCGKKGVVARLGGDEFAILLPNSTPELAETLRKDVLAEIERPVTLTTPKGTTATLGASIGLATFPEDGTTADALLTLADERMYSKKKGR